MHETAKHMTREEAYDLGLNHYRTGGVCGSIRDEIDADPILAKAYAEGKVVGGRRALMLGGW